VLTANYSGESFFDNFEFVTYDDPTHGYVDYVSKQDALNWGYISANDSGVRIGCDSWSISSGRGRGSVRIQSNAAWNTALFALDLDHMPTGCATWPAWWLCGPDWPNGGEIDIIEGVNRMINDHTTLHTSDKCSMQSESTNEFSGTWATGSTGEPSTNCYVNAPDQWSNEGCSIIGADDSYGEPFNQRSGGVVVTEWTTSFIRMFYFDRNSIPSDLTAGVPNPNSWGLPYAFFQLGENCTSTHFHDLNIIINLTFCGDWAGSDFINSCPGRGSCQSFTQNTPSAFVDAFWMIRSLTVYQWVTSVHNGHGTPAPAPAPAPASTPATAT